MTIAKRNLSLAARHALDVGVFLPRHVRGFFRHSLICVLRRQRWSLDRKWMRWDSLRHQGIILVKITDSPWRNRTRTKNDTFFQHIWKKQHVFLQRVRHANCFWNYSTLIALCRLHSDLVLLPFVFRCEIPHCLTQCDRFFLEVYPLPCKTPPPPRKNPIICSLLNCSIFFTVL